MWVEKQLELAEAEGVKPDFWPGEGEVELDFWQAEGAVREEPLEEAGVVVPQGLLYEVEAEEALEVPDFDLEALAELTLCAPLGREEELRNVGRCLPLAS